MTITGKDGRGEEREEEEEEEKEEEEKPRVASTAKTTDRGGGGGGDTGGIARASPTTYVQMYSINTHTSTSLLTTYRAFSDGAIVHLFLVAMAVFCIAVWMATLP